MPAAGILGIDEDQRRVVAVDDKTGDKPCVGVVVDVMHAGDAGYVAEDAVVGTSDPAQQVENREADRGEDPVQHAKDQHRSGGGYGEHEFAAAKAGEPAELRDVDEPYGRVDDECTQGRIGERGQHVSTDQQRDDDNTERDQRVQLASAAQ